MQEDEKLVLFLAIQSPDTFSEFRIESRNNDVITLEVGVANLLHALKAGARSHFVTIKLTKKGTTPYLTVDAQVRVDDWLAVLRPLSACPHV
jgi:hypothetical protein